jgi:hypothetical protein
MTDEWWKTRLVVLTIEPLLVPALERSLQGKIKEEMVRTGLNPNAAHDMAFGGSGLVLQKEIMFEEGKVWEDGKISFTKMNKDCYLKNGIQIQMN